MNVMRVPTVLALAGAYSATLLAAVAILLLAPGALPTAGADCPDAELVFARGRHEPPGAGRIGDALYSTLRARTDKNVTLYGVNYPADTQIDIGANDMSQHVQNMAASCPNTKMVLGGYSLGAASTDMVLAMPNPVMGFKKPLPPSAAPHVAAVALFGNGTQWVGSIGVASPAFAGKIVEMCHTDDPICNVTPNVNTFVSNWSDHLQPAYIDSGMVDEAADFVAARING
jgi:cutinase